ncbi:MAG: HAD-IIIA family hydrolase, partial [Anaerolineae bacterium]|nr:HAD-IIIA family hydrolase [Anaerolineae bacterium]
SKMTTIKAILLDLDNTLIVNPDRAFAAAFLREFQQALNKSFPEIDATTLFRDGLQLLSGQRRGDETNYARIVRHLIETAKSDRIAEVLTDFYATAYPRLSSWVETVPGAAELILKLHKEGYAIVIATNPIYPAAAVRHRMAWGGLPLDESLYALITNADNMHFSKPSPAYYAEIIGRVGIEPDEALMVGDRLSNDIEPAALIGIHTYHSKTNKLEELPRMVEELQDVRKPLNLQPDGVIAQLRGNIGAFYGFMAHIKPNYWLQRPDADEWSLLQIFCHLAEVEVTEHRARLERILQQENPFLVGNEPPGADIPLCDEDGIRVAARFVEEREKTLALLQSIPAESWNRPARHSVFGLTTFIEMAYFTAQHDRLHLNQICQTLGRCS